VNEDKVCEKMSEMCHVRKRRRKFLGIDPGKYKKNGVWTILRCGVIFLSCSILFIAILMVASHGSQGISLEAPYVGNSMVDLEWSKHSSENFSRYEILRDGDIIKGESDENIIFYRDNGVDKDVGYDYEVRVINKTGDQVENDTLIITTGFVRGTINIDTTWSSSTGSYDMFNDVTIAENATLTIGKDVVVNMDSNKINMIGILSDLDSVEFNGGSLFVEGIDGFSIKDCIFNGSSGGGFYGIEIKNCNDSVITNTEIRYYTKGDGISIEDCNSMDIIGNTIENNEDFGIHVENSPLCTIKDNYIFNNSDSGIFMRDSIDGWLQNNELLDNSHGIEIYSSDYCVIKECIVNENDHGGIHLEGSMGCELTELTIYDNGGNGMSCENPDDYIIEDNEIVRNEGHGIILSNFGSDMKVQRNVIRSSGNYGIYSQGTGEELLMQDNEIMGNTEYGIHLTNIQTAIIRRNTVSYNGRTGMVVTQIGSCTFTDNAALNNDADGGILLGIMDNMTISGITARDNDGYGMYLYQYSSSLITENTLMNNTAEGIRIENSDSLNITENIMSGNDHGILLSSSTQNNILKNTVQDNFLQGIELSYSDSNILTENTVSYNWEGVHLYQSEKNNVTLNNLSSNTHGVRIKSSILNTFTENVVRDNDDYGVYNEFKDNTFTSNNISGNREYGIYLYGAHNSTVTGNIIMNNRYGIKIWDTIDCMIQYNDISQNTVNGILVYSAAGNNTIFRNDFWHNNIGIALTGSEGTRISDNELYENNIGIQSIFSEEFTIDNTTFGRNEIYGISLRESVNGTFERNRIMRDGSKVDSWGLHIDNLSSDNRIEENVFGEIHPTLISIPDYYLGFMVRGVDDPPEPPEPPEYMVWKDDIGLFIEITNLSSNTSLFLDFHFTDEDVIETDVLSLKVWKYDENMWVDGKGDDPWNGTRKLDVLFDIVGVEIKEFCIFAPLGGYPVVNVDTEKKFWNIREAIEDPETRNGHVIIVYPEYTYEKRSENIVIDKELTIRSFTGSPEEAVIKALYSDEHTIQIKAENVNIEGFTIEGAWEDSKAGIHVDGVAQDISISKCIITKNHNGLEVTDDDDASIMLDNVKIRENTGDGIVTLWESPGSENNEIVIKGSGNEITNNEGNGVSLLNGTLRFEGTTEINNNGMWGIMAFHGNVIIQENTIASIHSNGGGGLFCGNDMDLPVNMIVENNNGPGINFGGKDLLLENVKIVNNKEDGISLFKWADTTQEGSIVIEGSDNTITGNGGDGIIASRGNIIIKGITGIHDNAGWGVKAAEGSVDIHEGAMTSIKDNGGGGIFGEHGVNLPAGFEIMGNGGDGLYCGVQQTLTLSGIRISKNDGHGIFAWNSDLSGPGGNIIIEGNSNEFIENGKSGILAVDGDIEIIGESAVHDNGGWGIYAGNGQVEIHDNAMSTLSLNGEGGIYGDTGIHLPSNFVVEKNGGPGLKSGEADLILENVRVRENKGDGILVSALVGAGIRGKLYLVGSETVISDNDGWGIRTGEGDVIIENGALITRNGKGGIRLGSSWSSRIYHCDITENNGYGIFCEYSYGRIQANNILDNKGGVFCNYGSSPSINWNNINGNTDYGVNNLDNTKSINAKNNWWGDHRGPGGNGPGSGDSVSEFVKYIPWLSSGYTKKNLQEVQAGNGTVDVKQEMDIAVDYDSNINMNITTLRYEKNPGEGFQGDVGKYIDVHIDNATEVNEILIKLYYTENDLNGKDESSLVMWWWDGIDWKECSDTGVETADVDGYSGYIWATVSSDTSPSLEELVGTPFGAGEDVSQSGEQEDDDGSPVTAAILGVVLILLMAGIGYYLLMERKGPGKDEQQEVDDKKEAVSGNEDKNGEGKEPEEDVKKESDGKPIQDSPEEEDRM